MEEDRARLEAFLKKSKKKNYYANDADSFQALCSSADDALFNKIMNDPTHVLFRFFPRVRTHDHNLRARGHNFSLPLKDDTNFCSRVLFKDMY